MKALITGASSGIGKNLAHEFARLGYDLVLVSRTKQNLEKVKKEINYNVKVEIYPIDISNIDNCIKLHNEVKNIDILVNNAGFGLFGEFYSTSLDKEIDMINTNIVSLHTLTKLYLQDMIKKDSGYILNVASIAGFMPGPLMATYYATKNYVVSLSEAIKEELNKTKSKVHISILCPGPVKTNFDNIAGVNFSLKGKDSNYVAKYAVKKLFQKKFYIIPGKDIYLLKILKNLLPNKLIAKVVYHQQKKKDNKKRGN